jgi:hypothetical protein
VDYVEVYFENISMTKYLQARICFLIQNQHLTFQPWFAEVGMYTSKFYILHIFKDPPCIKTQIIDFSGTLATHNNRELMIL